MLKGITEKDKWYSKVFQDDIVEEWRKEFINQETKINLSPEYESNYTISRGTSVVNANNFFDLVIRFARATAQGSCHKEDCSWNYIAREDSLCEKCREDVRNNPKKYNIDQENVESVHDLDYLG